MENESDDKEIQTQVEETPIESPELKSVQHGARPACFKSTFQEVLFVFTATMAIGIASMTAGSVTVITSFVGRDLNMSTPEITWIAASSS